MGSSLNRLREWFIELHHRIRQEVPPPEAFGAIVKAVSDAFGTAFVKYLGSGDNGIAYLTSDGSIVKFTIDKNEALLWHRLKEKTQAGIVQLQKIANLSSSKKGNSAVYVLKTEYAPNPITTQQKQLIRQATELARQATERDLHNMGVKRTPQAYRTRRTINFIKRFQEIADQDSAFSEIPGLLIDLADKHGGYIYDLQPDNFRRNLNNKIILIDPSVPDLVGDIQHPEELMYEDKLELVFKTDKVFY